ncbi:MAG: AI-2E family transporter [Bacteroidetes bacterium GWF2_33_38]|nr:MAG: AI-2E family transporter [Bacteroidetes bacterium GWF2_33_38]OFY76195.1 MAG: AI-2E family transporter [Bacteroidetes bacterium RIFOXYA12_FULL_33_9]
MSESEIKMPFYAKSTIIIVGLIAFFTMLYIAQDIIIPLIFSIIIAIVLHPIVNFFVRHRIKRLLAISITIFTTFILISAIGMLFFSQAIKFGQSWPILVEKFTEIIDQSVSWTSTYFDIKPQNINAWLTKTKSELININTSTIGQTLSAVGNWIIILFLVPVYVFIMLYYHSLLIEFIHKVFSSSDQNKVSEIISQIKSVIQHYLIGLIIEFSIVSTLYTITLLSLGIDYAILLGIIGGFINVIPYVGGLVGVALPMMIALATKSTAWYAVYVMAIYYVIQLIDNNYIVPIIVASKVKINALFSIIVVIAGNALWGISGMFLSIPLLAIVKVIFDHIDPLKPWGFLLGDTMPSLLKMKLKFGKKV